MSCLAIIGMLIAASVLGLMVGLTLRWVASLALAQRSDGSVDMVASVAAVIGLVAGAASFAYFLYGNPGLGVPIGRIALGSCCGLCVLAVVIGLIGRLWNP